MERIQRQIHSGVRTVDREQGVVDYLASTENVCDDGLRLLVPRWNIARFQKCPVMPWCHTYKPKDGFDARPVAVARGVKRDVEGRMFGRPGLVIRAQFNGLEHANHFAHSIGLHVMDGRLPAVSAGFRPVDPEQIREGERIFYQPRAQILVEASPCVIGMDEDALAQISRSIDDPAERAAFEATSRGFGQAVGIPVDGLPEMVRALLAEDAERGADVDSWIEDGFAWEGRTYEVQGGAPASPGPDTTAPAADAVVPAAPVAPAARTAPDTSGAVATIQKACGAICSAVLEVVAQAGAGAPEDLVSVAGYVCGMAGQVQAAIPALVASAAGVELEDTTSTDGAAELVQLAASKPYRAAVDELRTHLEERFEGVHRALVDLFSLTQEREHQAAQDAVRSQPGSTVEAPAAPVEVQPPAPPAVRVMSEAETIAFYKASAREALKTTKGHVSRRSPAAGATP